MKDKTIAAILAFFLGGFGVHRFYLDQVGKGIAYLLFSWTGIPSIIGFVDFIGFLMYSEADFNRKYNPDHFLKERYVSHAQAAAAQPQPALSDAEPFPDRRQAIRIHTENIQKGMEAKNYGKVNQSYVKLLELLRQQNILETGKYDELIAQAEEDYAAFKKAYFSD